MSTRNIQQSTTSASGRQASLGVGVGAGAAGLPPVPPALLRLIPQIKAARGNDNGETTRFTIKLAWDGTLNILIDF